MSRLQATVAIREQQHGMAVQLPETTQQLERCIRQGNETVFIAVWSKNSSVSRYQHLIIYCLCHNVFEICLR